MSIKNFVLALSFAFSLSFGLQAQAHCGSCGKGEEKKSCAEECKEKGHECEHKEGEHKDGEGHAHHGKEHKGDHAKSDKSCEGHKDCSHCKEKKAEKAKKPAA